MIDSPFHSISSIYHIYIRSFCDSDGDGIGDLNGATSKLSYIKDLGFNTIWLSPFYESPQVDFGYDITDHSAISPEMGNMDDFDALVAKAQECGIKVILDLVLNHTSDQHAWFQDSRSSRSSEKRDWYIWADGRSKSPPNNWRSMTGGSGWNFDSSTGQWYWSSFFSCLPDLNYKNLEVKALMFKVVEFWLNRGVDGFRLDVISCVHKDAMLRANPLTWDLIPSSENPMGSFQKPIRTINTPDTYRFAEELRQLVDSHSNHSIFLIGEAFGSRDELKEYCVPNRLNTVFQWKMLDGRFTAKNIRKILKANEQDYQSPILPTYVTGNHDRKRLISRLGNDIRKVKLLLTLLFTTRCIPCLYYGDELGIPQAKFRLKEGHDFLAQKFSKLPDFMHTLVRRFSESFNRDECRTPMPWGGDTMNETNKSPWLPVQSGLDAVDTHKAHEKSDSILNLVKQLQELRNALPTLVSAPLEFIDCSRPNLIAYRRKSRETTDVVEVYMNFSNKQVEIPTLDLQNPVCLYSSGREAKSPTMLAPWEGIVITHNKAR